MVQRVFHRMPTHDSPTLVRYLFLMLCIEAVMQPIFEYKNHECGKWRSSLARAEGQLHLEEVRGVVIEERLDRSKRELSRNNTPDEFRRLHEQFLKAQQQREHHRSNLRRFTQKVEHAKSAQPYVCKRRGPR